MCRKYVIIGVLIALAMLFVSCGEEKKPAGPAETVSTTVAVDDETAPVTPPDAATVPLSEKIADFALVVPENPTAFQQQTAGSVIANLKNRAKAEVEDETDTYEPDTPERWEILVGNTSRSDTQAALAKLNYNQYGVFLSGHKVVIAGWTEYTTRLASIQFNTLLQSILTKNASGDYCFRLEEGKTEFIETCNEYLGDLPAFDGTIKGVYDCADGYYEVIYRDMTAADFNAYQTAVLGQGYTVSMENTLGSNLYATCVKGDQLLHFYFVSFSHELRVIYGKNDLIPSLIGQTTAGTVTPRVTVMPMTYTAAAGGGACIIFTLRDGTFVVVDGGWAAEAPLLYQTLSALNADANGADHPIVISAWFFSHAHGDHMGCVYQFATDYAAQVKVNALIYNAVDPTQTAACKNRPDALDRDRVSQSLLNKFTTVGGERPSAMKLHSGQKLDFGGMSLEVLFTHEDLFDKRITNFNDFNTVLKITLGENTFFMTGDATNVELPSLINEVDAAVLKCDFCQVGHHGADSGYRGIYEKVRAKYYIWNNSQAHYIRDTEQNKYSYCLYILENAREIYLADKVCTTVELPYAEGTAVTWDYATEKPSEKLPSVPLFKYSATASYGKVVGWDDGEIF